MTTKMKKAITTCTKPLVAMLIAVILILGAMPVTIMAESINISGAGPFTVGAGVTATVTGSITGNITVNGGTLILNANHTITGGVTVQNGGTFNMSSGTITGSSASGVTVENSGSTFNMNGGVITGNYAYRYGGGVLVRDYAIFNMSNMALIQDNTALGGGGVNVEGGSRFYMDGGSIQNNHLRSSSSVGGGVRVSGEGAIFNMTSGTISNHNFTNGASGSGVAVVNNAVFVMDGVSALITNNSGGTGAGTSINNARFYMYAGEISHNHTTSSVGGGGIRIFTNTDITDAGGSQANFVMRGGFICSNTATLAVGATSGNAQGGGISSSNASFTIYDGSIRNNISGSAGDSVTVRGGGGIHMNSASVGIMHGGKIYGNFAYNNGGGVHFQASSYFTVTGGQITNNSAPNGFGGGIWAHNYRFLTVYDTVVFSNNTANAPHNFGAANRGVSITVPAANGGPGAQGGNPQNINWATVSIPGTHALNNFDINYTSIPADVPDIAIRKELRMPYGTDLPTESFEFQFDIELVSVSPAVASLPAIEITIPPVPFTPGMTPAPVSPPDGSSDVYVHVYIPINLTVDMFPMPGVFRFRVTEIAGSSSLGSTPDYIIEYDPSVFYLYVYVGRPREAMTDPMEIMGVYVRRMVPPTPCEGCEDGTCECEEDDCDCGTYQYILLDKDPVLIPFINRFSRRTPPTSFEVEKIVTGRMADANLPFNFTVALEIPASTPLPLSNSIVATVTEYARDGYGQIIMPAVRVPVSSPAAITITVDPDTRIATHTFTLRHGDIIWFSNVPVGTEYTVTEWFVAGYDQSGIINGDISTLVVADDDEDLEISGIILPPANGTDVTNFVTVTNAHDETPPMGVLLSNVPFGLMVALGAGALSLIAAAVIVGSKVKAKR